MTEAQKRGRRTLLLITLMFAVPIAAAMYMYYWGSELTPVGSTAHGDLITPARPLPELPLVAAEDRRLRKLWTMIVLADRECGASCVQALVHMRQIRLSLGPKMTRLQTVLMPGEGVALSAELQREHPKLIIAEAATTADIRAIIGAHQDGQIFLVDPLGNLMMSYPPGADMGDIRKDLTHLFELSGIG